VVRFDGGFFLSTANWAVLLIDAFHSVGRGLFLSVRLIPPWSAFTPDEAFALSRKPAWELSGHSAPRGHEGRRPLSPGSFVRVAQAGSLCYERLIRENSSPCEPSTTVHWFARIKNVNLKTIRGRDWLMIGFGC